MTAHHDVRQSALVLLAVSGFFLVLGVSTWAIALGAVCGGTLLLIRHRTGWTPPDRWPRGAETVSLILIVAAVAYMVYTVTVIVS